MHSFSGADGAGPYVTVVADGHGNLYGTTYDGGAYGAGVVFKLAPPPVGRTSWTETLLHTFAGNVSDGGGPDSDLVFDAGGVLYGTTSGGGAYDQGTVFKLAPPAAGRIAWTETVLHAFSNFDPDGGTPFAGLTISKGALFGTTFYGGFGYGANYPQSGAGTVFKVVP